VARRRPARAAGDRRRTRRRLAHQHDPARRRTGTGAAPSQRWQPLYRFTLEAQQWLDYLPRNWYTSTHPDSIFRKALKVAISEAGAPDPAQRPRFAGAAPTDRWSNG
jgi:arylamine N-acetyltransferase